MAVVELRADADLGGGDAVTATTSSADGWAGAVVVAATGDPAARPHLLAVTTTDAFRCGGTCPAPQGATTAVSAVDLVLPRGTYRVVLAGPAGSTVTLRLEPDGSTGDPVEVVADQEPQTYVAEVARGEGPAGRETALRTYGELPAGGAWGGALLVRPYVVEPVGLLAAQACLTAGSTAPAPRQVGGSAPCRDLQGEDFNAGPDVSVVQPDSGGAAPATGVGAYLLSGRSDAPFGLGVDLAAAGATRSHLRTVLVGATVF